MAAPLGRQKRLSELLIQSSFGPKRLGSPSGAVSHIASGPAEIVHRIGAVHRRKEKQAGEKRASIERPVDVDVLVERVGPVSDGPQSVQRRGPEARRVSVGHAPRPALLQV